MTSNHERLGRLKTRLAALNWSHVLVGAGCACGLPAGHIDLSTLKQTLSSYLARKYRMANEPELAFLFKAAEADLTAAIDAALDHKPSMSEAALGLLCADLEEALSSFDEISPGRPRTAGTFSAF